MESLFPRGIPIGTVTKVDLDELEQYQRVHIKPFANLRRFDIVQVLTRRPAGPQAAALPEGSRRDRRSHGLRAGGVLLLLR